eukprot:6208769-Pyramimonas_sp.AAC.1
MQVSTGLNETNLNLLAATAILQHGYQIPILVAGDYNMSPSKLQENDFIQRAGMQIIQPSSPTCRTKASQSCLDYFVYSGCLQHVLHTPH